MEIRVLGTESNGTRSVEIRSGELSYRALLRHIKRIPGANVTHAMHDPMNDNTEVIVRYKDIILTIDTPFSDYIINCISSSVAFDEFISKLRSAPVKWWERYI